MLISQFLRENRCTMLAKIKQYNNNEVRSEFLIDIDSSLQIIDTNGGQWNCKIKAEPVPAQSANLLDVTLTLELAEGEASEHGFSIEFTMEEWSDSHYLLLPGAVYNGNRFEAKPLPYPPFLSSKDEMKVDGPVLITDVPRLSNREGETSSIDLLSGDLATPAIGFHSPISQTGCWILTTQETAAGQTGLHIKESEERSSAVIKLTFPGMREGNIYRICNRNGELSTDRAAGFKKGEVLVIRFQIGFFTCPSVQRLFDSFVSMRKQLTGDPELANSIPFSASWKVQEVAFNLRWNENGEYYPSFNDDFLDYQIGWVGGTNATYALLAEGSETSVKRAIRSTQRLLNKGQAPTGFLYSSGKNGKLVNDGIWEPWPHNLFSIRKNGDALYFLLKQCLLLKRDDRFNAVIEAWMEPLRRLADAFVRLWNTNGQLGQFADIETSELRVGGSTAGAIVPAGLALSGVFLDRPEYIEAAEAAALFYYEHDVQSGVTTGGPTEILQCPDSESAYAMLESFVILYETTGHRHWLDKACEMAHQCATWNVSYDYRWPSGTEFGRLAIQTSGSVIANVQNKHSAPGICTLSGDSLFKLFRYTGNFFYLEMIRETAHNLPQYLSREDRPIFSWDEIPVQLQAGMMCERVNMSDWEGKSNIGGVFCGITWAEIANMLTFAEIPGVYVQLDTGLIIAIDHVEAVKVSESPLVVRLTNSTLFEAEVKVLAEYSNIRSEANELSARLECRRVRLQPGEESVLSFEDI